MMEKGRVCPWAVGDLATHAHTPDMPPDFPCKGEGITVGEVVDWILKSAPLESGWVVPRGWEGTD